MQEWQTYVVISRSPKVHFPESLLESWVSAFEVRNTHWWMHPLRSVLRWVAGRYGEVRGPSCHSCIRLLPALACMVRTTQPWQFGSWPQRANGRLSQRSRSMNLKACSLYGQFLLRTSNIVDLGNPSLETLLWASFWSEHCVPSSCSL